jgi:hypothetical protein
MIAIGNPTIPISRAFRRGALAGALASAVLAVSLAAAAFASGLVQTPPADNAPPAVQARPAPAIHVHNPLHKGPIQAY